MSDLDLLETLRQAQRFGFFGARPIEEAMAHAEQYVAALGDIPPDARVLDLGSGGGLPGLVIAAAVRPARVVLLDRRAKRTDFLERAVLRLGFDHVDVWCRDASAVTRDIAAGLLHPFDAVTARGFGPPEETLRIARACLARQGRIVISEPPQGERWSLRLLDELALAAESFAGVRVFSPHN